MMYDVFRRDVTDVYWVVGCGQQVRHAMTTQPGAVFFGEWVAAVCETWVKIPPSTPFDRTPASKAVTARCPECAEVTASSGYCDNEWDF